MVCQLCIQKRVIVFSQQTKKVSSSCSYNLQRISQINNRYFDCPTKAIILIFYVAGSLVPNTIFLVLHFLYCTDDAKENSFDLVLKSLRHKNDWPQYTKAVYKWGWAHIPLTNPKWVPLKRKNIIPDIDNTWMCISITHALLCLLFSKLSR